MIWIKPSFFPSTNSILTKSKYGLNTHSCCKLYYDINARLVPMHGLQLLKLCGQKSM